MSSNTHYESVDQPARYAPSRVESRPQSAASVSRNLHRSKDGYTLIHGGRQVRIGPVAFWIAVGTLIIMAVWSLATGSYFAFREDVLTRLVGRQAEMQFAYEDRIADLRSQVDRITSRQLLDQEQFEQKLESLLRRQATLEQRSSALAGDAPPQRGRNVPRGPQKPTPLSDNGDYAFPAERHSALDPSGHIKLPKGKLDTILGKVASSLDRIEQRQDSTVASMQDKLEAKLQRVHSVIADLGISLGKHGDDVTGAIGGPFVPLKAPANGASTFERELYRVNYTRAQADRMNQTLNSVPLRKPVEGEIEMNSPFGTRMDPFLGGPAIHTGIDLHGETGEPAHATATGTVTIASWSGGYGNMVEIDHLNGLSTRYGHLSKILVKVGQHVRIGEVVGLIGSTGRSTGPHLHYETRINDSAVDPQKFLHAGQKLGVF